MKMGSNRMRALVIGAAALALLAGLAPRALDAHHGDIHARCEGNTPVITQRPPGTEHVQVICRDGLPEFMVAPPPIPAYNPVAQALPESKVLPPDFGGWATVWLNGRPLKTPYDPVRGIQEPGPYLSASTGRVMMPARFFTEAFGGYVIWDEVGRKGDFHLKGQRLQLGIGEARATVGTRNVRQLDQAPVIFQDRMFVPVRFLGEVMGARVEWDHMGRSVQIYMDGVSCSNASYCGEVR